MGSEFAGSIGFMLLIGWWVDRELGTSPRWTTVGGVLGLVGGGANFARRAVRLVKATSRVDRRGDASGGGPMSGSGGGA